MDLISVIVPVYQVEAYLDRCVQSIVDQTYTNLDIILVDDGSPDRCPQMCDEWAKRDGRIRVIHKENGGLSDARNAGLRMASGIYIAFVDSDDWVFESYIERLNQAIGHTRAKMAACGVRFVDDETKNVGLRGKNPVIQVLSAEQALSEQGWRKIRAVAWNKLYHRSLLEGEEYPVGKYHEDEFFTYRIVDKAGRVAFVEDELYCYYQRPGSIMHEFSMKRLDALEAYMQRLHLLKEKYPVLYQQEKANCCVSFAGFYCGALQSGVVDMHEVRDKIIGYRRQMRFSVSEWRQYSLRQKLYIVGTGVNLPLFCRILHIRRRK